MTKERFNATPNGLQARQKGLLPWLFWLLLLSQFLTDEGCLVSCWTSPASLASLRQHTCGYSCWSRRKVEGCKTTFLRKSHHGEDDESTVVFFKKSRSLKCGKNLKHIIAAFTLSASLLVNCPASAMDPIPAGQRYWNIMSSTSSSSVPERIAANEALLDFLVGTINTQFYDNTGGAFFAPRDFYHKWKLYKQLAEGEPIEERIKLGTIPADVHLETRDGAVRSLKWLVSLLNDPFSNYLTREELQEELKAGESNGFLGTGAVVETPHAYSMGEFSSFFGPQQLVVEAEKTKAFNIVSAIPIPSNKIEHGSQKKILTITRASNLPVVTAVAPDSSAERAGLVVGDRIVAVGESNFLGWTRAQVERELNGKYNQKDYFGQADLTVAKPILVSQTISIDDASGTDTIPTSFSGSSEMNNLPDLVLGYRQTKLRLPINSSSQTPPGIQKMRTDDQIIAGGDAIVHYQLLTSRGSIFERSTKTDSEELSDIDDNKIGYIRLTRFSKASTTRYVQAVHALEEAGAQSYILDVRNNYGGVIQEGMLTASTLLRDPHAVLCYTMNARGGFTPHDAEEYIVDKRYPGYLLSSESEKATVDQVQKENPAMFVDNGIAWDPPSSYASLHEQVTKRGIRRIGYRDDFAALLQRDPTLKAQFQAQKKVVVLINEGTASAAEVFVAALHDNARTTAVIGTQSYGKGLIQHTFPMPDGGGLRLTVAEYLTPALSHVTKVGGARYDSTSGQFVGSGIRPDIVCESKQGIPGNVRADLCVGVAMDALEEATIEVDDNDGEETGIASSRISSWLAGIPSMKEKD